MQDGMRHDIILSSTERGMTMRYQVMTDKYSGGEMVKFYESDDLQDAKDFAIRMCFFNECRVMVFDEKVEEVIRDFDDPKHK